MVLYLWVNYPFWVKLHFWVGNFKPSFHNCSSTRTVSMGNLIFKNVYYLKVREPLVLIAHGIHNYSPITHANMAHSTIVGFEPRWTVTSVESQSVSHWLSKNFAITTSILWEAKINKTEKRKRKLVSKRNMIEIYCKDRRGNLEKSVFYILSFMKNCHLPICQFTPVSFEWYDNFGFTFVHISDKNE